MLDDYFRIMDIGMSGFINDFPIGSEPLLLKLEALGLIEEVSDCDFNYNQPGIGIVYAITKKGKQFYEVLDVLFALGIEQLNSRLDRVEKTIDILYPDAHYHRNNDEVGVVSLY